MEDAWIIVQNVGVYMEPAKIELKKRFNDLDDDDNDDERNDGDEMTEDAITESRKFSLHDWMTATSKKKKKKMMMCEKKESKDNEVKHYFIGNLEEERVEINAFDDSEHWMQETGMEKISLTIDSGAAETVCNEEMAKDYMAQESEGSKKGVKYVAAGGKELANQGEKKVKIITNEGAKCMIKFQVAGVRKPLVSVSRICDEGHEVTFTKDGGHIRHLETNQLTKFVRKNGVYVMDVHVIPVGGPRPVSGFGWQGH